jgi:hypothetical protein
MIELPYTLIGKVTVSLLLAVAVEIAVVIALATFVFCWVRFWDKVLKYLWAGYHPANGEAPPSPRRELALIAYGLRHFKRPSEIHEDIKEVHRGER